MDTAKVRPPSLQHKPLPRNSTAPVAEVGELDLNPSNKLQGTWGTGGESSRCLGPCGVSLRGRTRRDDQSALGLLSGGWEGKGLGLSWLSGQE